MAIENKAFFRAGETPTSSSEIMEGSSSYKIS